MNTTEPSVYLIASTQLHHDNVARWLESVGGSNVLSHIAGSDGEKLIELAGRRCYKSFDML